ncbi:hypothetical protein [Dyella sp.]
MSIALIEEASRLPAVAHPRIPSWRIFADALLRAKEMAKTDRGTI